MAIISVTITESEDQIVEGIPRSVSIDTNISSTIFYTLDGSDPDVNSSIYLSTLILDSSELSITLKVFATNGADSSPIIIETYSSNVAEYQRRPHSSVVQSGTSEITYPFGNGKSGEVSQYSNSAGITVNSTGNESNADGYDADGSPNAYSDEPFNNENYSIRYSEDWNSNPLEGGVGTLPGPIKIQVEESPPGSTEVYSNTFDPKAMVIYQDFENETLDDIPLINSGVFSMQNSDNDNGGSRALATSLENASAPTAFFIKSHYNPRKNTITYYYRDSRTNKWIISTQPFNNNGPYNGSLANVIVSNKKGSRFVYKWIPNFRRALI